MVEKEARDDVKWMGKYGISLLNEAIRTMQKEQILEFVGTYEFSKCRSLVIYQ